VAFVLNEDGGFERRCNLSMVELEPVRDKADQAVLKGLIERHARFTGSAKAKTLLAQWDSSLSKFLRVMPVEYKKVMEQRKVSKAATRETAVHG
jgi:glutamate synthase domain-containing protein 3